MKRFAPKAELSHTRPIRRAMIVLGCLVSLIYVGGCTTPAQKTESQGNTIVGNPPSAEEDPFFVRGKPAEAVQVEAQGRIEPVEVAPPETTPAETASAETTPAEPKTEVSARGEVASTVETTPAETRPRKPEVPQCFSCVKICPASGDCAQADQDIICGWGTQTNASEAKTLARAQCDATLDLARRMPVWSRIDGECPPATCR